MINNKKVTKKLMQRAMERNILGLQSKNEDTILNSCGQENELHKLNSKVDMAHTYREE